MKREHSSEIKPDLTTEKIRQLKQDMSLPLQPIQLPDHGGLNPRQETRQSSRRPSGQYIVEGFYRENKPIERSIRLAAFDHGTLTVGGWWWEVLLYSAAANLIKALHS